MEGVTPIRSYSSDYNIARTATHKAEQGLTETSVASSTAKPVQDPSMLLSAPAKSRAEAERLASAFAQHEPAPSVKQPPSFAYEVKLFETKDATRVDAEEAVSTYLQVASIDQADQHSTDKLV